MEEMVLGGDLRVRLREAGGRNLLIQVSEDRLYRLPLEPEMHAALAALLSLSDEELAREVSRQEAAERIQVAATDVHATRREAPCPIG